MGTGAWERGWGHSTLALDSTENVSPEENESEEILDYLFEEVGNINSEEMSVMYPIMMKVKIKAFFKNWQQ